MLLNNVNRMSILLATEYHFSLTTSRMAIVCDQTER